MEPLHNFNTVPGALPDAETTIIDRSGANLLIWPILKLEMETLCIYTPMVPPYFWLFWAQKFHQALLETDWWRTYKLKNTVCEWPSILEFELSVGEYTLGRAKTHHGQKKKGQVSIFIVNFRFYAFDSTAHAIYLHGTSELMLHLVDILYHYPHFNPSLN